MPCAVLAVGASCARDLYTCQLWRDTTLASKPVARNEIMP